MICTKCNNKWAVNEKGVFGNCPLCEADALAMLNSQFDNPSVSTILKNALLVCKI
jgi:hypothetical protein